MKSVTKDFLSLHQRKQRRALIYVPFVTGLLPPTFNNAAFF